MTTRRYIRCLAGSLPGEALDLREADRLVTVLRWQGWSVLDIAEHTGWSSYTVARKLARLGMDITTTQGAGAA